MLSRRGKLKVKLEAEEKADLDQLRKMPAGVARKSLKDVRAEYEQMRMKRIEEQQKEAEERMLQHWKINNPEYREVFPYVPKSCILYDSSLSDHMFCINVLRLWISIKLFSCFLLQLQCKKRFEMVQKAWGDQKVEKEERESAERRQEEIRIRVEAEKVDQSF